MKRIVVLLGLLVLALTACNSHNEALPIDADPVIDGVVFTPTAPLVGQEVTISVTASDPDGGTVTYAYANTGGNAGEFPDPPSATASTTWTCTYNGEYSFEVTVTDDEGAIAVATPTLEVEIEMPVKPAAYAGVEACFVCHAGQINKTDFENHRHNHKINPPTAEYIGAWWTGSQTFTKDAAHVDMAMQVTDGQYECVIGGQTYPVFRAMGWGVEKWKQRYMVKNGNSIYITPAQWNVIPSAWAPYNVTDWANDAGLLNAGPFGRGPAKAAAYDRRCTGCHTTGVSVEFNDATEEWISVWRDDNIQCEACHGPGANHVAAPSAGNIVNPATDVADYQRKIEVCGQCHGRGESAELGGGKKLEYPWLEGTGGFVPGQQLAGFFVQTTKASDFWQNGPGGTNYNSKSHHQQYNDFMLSKHYSGASHTVTCWTCHSPHAPDAAYTNETCTGCHSDKADAAALEAHSHHSAVGGNNLCINCHMPWTAKSAIAYDVRSHTFEIISPQATLDMLNASPPATAPIPNSCINGGCHGGNTALTDLASVQGQLDQFNAWWP